MPLPLPKESYLKARELDTKGSYSQEIKIGLGGVQTAASNEESNDTALAILAQQVRFST